MDHEALSARLDELVAALEAYVAAVKAGKAKLGALGNNVLDTSAAFDNAIAEVTGEYIGFLGQDDEAIDLELEDEFEPGSQLVVHVRERFKVTDPSALIRSAGLEDEEPSEDALIRAMHSLLNRHGLEMTLRAAPNYGLEPLDGATEIEQL